MPRDWGCTILGTNCFVIRGTFAGLDSGRPDTSGKFLALGIVRRLAEVRKAAYLRNVCVKRH